MNHFLRTSWAALFMLAAFLSPASAANDSATVRVALLDMSSLMPIGMTGHGMMSQGQGMTGPGMMGPGQGMMGPGMMMGPGGMMAMMSIRIDKPSAKAGTVTFEVTNWSRSVIHEMLIVAVDNPSAPLPYDYVQGRVPEEQVKVLGEVEDLQPNATESISVALEAGSYLLICNIVGHYASSMVAPFSVAP